MQVKELIEELKKYPEDIEINFCWECCKSYKTLTLIINNKHIEILDKPWLT